MITHETVRLITEFEDWKYPNHHQHKFDGGEITTLDRWIESDIDGVLDDKGLNEDEKNRLEELLRQQPKSEIYEVVSNFIDWVLRNLPDYGEKYTDFLIYRMEYEYYYLGRKKSKYTDLDLENYWRSRDPKSRVHFWSRHYHTEYFEKTLPHYVETLRELIETHQLKEVV